MRWNIFSCLNLFLMIYKFISLSARLMVGKVPDYSFFSLSLFSYKSCLELKTGSSEVCHGLRFFFSILSCWVCTPRPHASALSLSYTTSLRIPPPPPCQHGFYLEVYFMALIINIYKFPVPHSDILNSFLTAPSETSWFLKIMKDLVGSRCFAVSFNFSIVEFIPYFLFYYSFWFESYLGRPSPCHLSSFNTSTRAQTLTDMTPRSKTSWKQILYSGVSNSSCSWLSDCSGANSVIFGNLKYH